MKKTISLKEIVVIAMISALIGVAFAGLDSVYEPLTKLLGPMGGEFIYGIYLLSALLPMYIIRKPGAALIGSLFTGLVNLLMGSPYGIHIIVGASLQGIGVEAVSYLWKYRKIDFIQLSLGAILAMLLGTVRDYFVFGFAMYKNLMPLMLFIRIVSSVIFGAILSIIIGKSLLATGVLNSFNIKKDMSR